MISLARFRAVKYLSTRSINYKINIMREARMLDRIIKKKISKPNTGDNVPKKLRQQVLTSAYDNEGTTRKTTALNKLYMEQIIELISCSSVSSKINELGIEFSKVKVSPCRTIVYVFWTTSKPETPDSEIAEALRDLKKDLQPQLGSLLPMRRTPYINFVRDLRLERENIVEKLLDIADFGKDYQPTSAKKVVNPESNELLKTDDAENLPMRQNVLGLDHAKIKEKLMQNIKRFQHINIKKDELEEIKEYEHTGKLAVFSKKLFTNFYRRKMYLEKKFRTREYNDSYVVLDKPYDPREEAEKYWELMKFKNDDLMVEEQEVEDYKNLCDDARDTKVERDIDDDICFHEDDKNDDELEEEKFNKKIDKD